VCVCWQIVFEILVRALIGLDAGDQMQYVKQQFREFMAGLISLPVKLPGTQLYSSLQVKIPNLNYVPY
jgi:steroid 3-oxidase